MWSSRAASRLSGPWWGRDGKGGWVCARRARGRRWERRDARGGAGTGTSFRRGVGPPRTRRFTVLGGWASRRCLPSVNSVHASDTGPREKIRGGRRIKGPTRVSCALGRRDALCVGRDESRIGNHDESRNEEVPRLAKRGGAEARETRRCRGSRNAEVPRLAKRGGAEARETRRCRGSRRCRCVRS